MDRRSTARVEVKLTVEVRGFDAHGKGFLDAAIVSNMSTAGLILQGLRRKIRTGEILDLRLGNDKAQYRVIWVGGFGTGRTGDLGMQRVTAQPFLVNSVLTCCAQAAGTC